MQAHINDYSLPCESMAVAWVIKINNNNNNNNIIIICSLTVKRVNKKEKASLTNVVNDIRRQKLLDDMEAAAGKKPEDVVESDLKPKNV